MGETTYRNNLQLKTRSHKRLAEGDLQKSSHSSAVIPNYGQAVCKSRGIGPHMSLCSVNAFANS